VSYGPNYGRISDQQAAPNVKISVDSSPLAAWVIRTDEGMQLANECVLIMN
jgi:hypothetical protein